MLNVTRFRKYRALFTLVGISLLVQGCGGKIDCNDDGFKGVAIGLIKTRLEQAVWYKQIALALSGTPALANIKTLARNDELKTGKCAATYTFVYNGKEREVDMEYDLAYLEDKKDTEVSVNVNGVAAGVMSIVMSEGPKKNGVEKFTDPRSGNLQRTVTWKDGVQDGVEEVFNPANGKLVGRANFVGGKKAGVEQGWTSDGVKLLMELNWVDGKASGTHKVYNVAGDKLLTDLVWKDNIANGYQSVAQGGALADGSGSYEFFTIKNNMKDGPYKSFEIVGANSSALYLKYDGAYKEDKPHGVIREFNAAGESRGTRTYADGELVSSTVEFSPDDGKLAIEKCVQAKVDAHNKAYPDAGVRFDVLNEWKEACGGTADEA